MDDEQKEASDGQDSERREVASDPEAQFTTRKWNQASYQTENANKVSQFRLAVNVYEARRLQGVGSNPTLRVALKCNSKVKKTRSKRGSVSPIFNELKVFKLEASFLELLDMILEVTVMNDVSMKYLRHRDAGLVGTYKMELSMLFKQTPHIFRSKWLILSSCKSNLGEVKGYLKVSIHITGPGEIPLDLLLEEPSSDDDIHRNLLVPSGVSFIPGILKVRVFRAEELPQTDPQFALVKKLRRATHSTDGPPSDSVDAYCVVKFAQHKEKTECVENNYDPEWNTEIQIPTNFPSMCDRIQFQVMDRDKLSSDDYIGTVHLKLSDISQDGEAGFPPTFGPCFVNLYGSTREFNSEREDVDDMNTGKVEGVAYRGRVLVEITSTLDSTLPGIVKKKINPSESVRQDLDSNFGGYHENYKLMAVLLSANMVNPHDGMVEFEVSIGTSGYQLTTEENDETYSSRTSPIRPIQRRLQNYYIPWLEQKPCIVLDIKLEDCLYRIHALNILLRLADKFEEQLIIARELRKNRDNHSNTKQALMNFFETVIPSLEQELPFSAYANDLDSRLRELRTVELSAIRDEVQQLRREVVGDESGDGAKLSSAVMERLAGHLSRIRHLCVECQNSLPDVVIWMLCGNERVAVKRVSSHEVMHSARPPEGRGRNCGRIQEIVLEPPEMVNSPSITRHQRGAQLSLILWLGLEKDFERNEAEITAYFTGVEYATHGEVYEYRHYSTTKRHWNSKLLFRDARGRSIDASDLDQLQPSSDTGDWEWDRESEWQFRQPFDSDGGVSNEYTEKIYQIQSIPDEDGESEKEVTIWKDEQGEELPPGFTPGKDDAKCPEGWKWKRDATWSVNHHGSLDYDGWLYATDISSPLSSWIPRQRTYHKYKMREYTRVRQKTFPPLLTQEGWEYATSSSHNQVFSSTERAMNHHRRRRLTRKAVCTSKQHDERSFSLIRKLPRKKEVPLQKNLIFQECHTFQLRAYIYRAKDLFRGDNSGLSDPYAVVTFGNHSEASVVIKKSLNPVWNETILISDVRLCGDLTEGGFISKQQNIKGVTIQIWDADSMGKDEYLGETRSAPVVQLDFTDQKVELKWLELKREGESAGELLAAFELVLNEGEMKVSFPMDERGEYNQIVVPEGIAPHMEEYTVEFRCWGVRDMKKLNLLHINSPVVELECEGAKIAKYSLSNSNKNDNFLRPLSITSKKIPTARYLPSMTITAHDRRLMRRMLHVGSHVIPSVEPYLVLEQRKKSDPSTIKMPSGKKPFKLQRPPADYEVEMVYDWWSKYYSSLEGREDWVQRAYVTNNMDTLKVYHNELENNFKDGLMDFLQSFPLFRGKGPDNGDPEDQVGSVKGTIRLYPTMSPSVHGPVLSDSPSTTPVNILVRVYVVEAINLTPQDMITGSSDPYLLVSIGKTKLDSKQDKLKNDLNPVFGRMFELDATLPRDHTLSVTVMDYDRGPLHDDMIGTTEIDVENRFYSNHGATCGLPQTVTVYGINKWRKRLSPVELLYDWVKREGLPNPVWSNHDEDSPYSLQVNIGKDCYKLGELEIADQPVEVCPDPFQRLALLVLRCQEQDHEPKFVPEYVETRTLYHPMQPGIEQGKLRMWVDIFERDYPIPPPVVITRREPEEYELRVIVWNTTQVELQEVSLVSREPMSDIYVKGWFCTPKNSQKTDVHYRSLDGTGNFNWRFVFPFKYIVAENHVVIEERDHFYNLDRARHLKHPVFVIEVWDDDAFSRDDFIGRIEFDLTKMHPSLRQQSLEDHRSQPHNLFTTSRMKGWWPVMSIEENPKLKGNVQLEFELLSREEAEEKPAGKGRSDPNMNPFLHKPIRPESSFFWLLSPLKSFRFIIWKHYKWYIIGVIALIILIAVTVAIIYTLPSHIIQATVNRIFTVSD